MNIEKVGFLFFFKLRPISICFHIFRFFDKSENSIGPIPNSVPMQSNVYRRHNALNSVRFNVWRVFCPAFLSIMLVEHFETVLNSCSSFPSIKEITSTIGRKYQDQSMKGYCFAFRTMSLSKFWTTFSKMFGPVLR